MPSSCYNCSARLASSTLTHTMATRTSLPALARSVGGVIDVQGAVVFRVPGVDNTFSAHSSIDGSVFVQTLEVCCCAFALDAVAVGQNCLSGIHQQPRKLLYGLLLLLACRARVVSVVLSHETVTARLAGRRFTSAALRCRHRCSSSTR